MSKRILVVDDDENLRPALVKLLDSCGFKTVGAADGQSGFSLFMSGEFDLVISDIRMPKMSGLELMKAIQSTKPVPVILITGFSELLEMQEAYELGASGFLAKPFKKVDLLAVIEKSLGMEIAPGAVSEAEEYCKLNVDDFVSGRQLQFDIFICILTDKFIKVAHGGEDLSPDRIAGYKAKGLRFLYLRKADFTKYVGMSLALLSAVRESGRAPIEKKLNLLKHTGEVILEKVRIDGLDEENYDYARTFIDNSLLILGDSKDAIELLSALSSHTDFVYAHSVGCSMISVLIARQMGWVTISNLFKVAMAGLLHDVGEKEIEVAVLSKARKDLTITEIKLKESHTSRGAEIAGNIRGVPSDVLQVIAQHHEDCVGQGFPKGLRRSHIHPMARLIAVASEFCSLVLDAPNSPALDSKSAVKRLVNFSSSKLDPDFLSALGRLFKTEGQGALPPSAQGKPGSGKELEWSRT